MVVCSRNADNPVPRAFGVGERGEDSMVVQNPVMAQNLISSQSVASMASAAF